ncbi:hypothetical protein [Peterkaempfera sp. SMS 1(5)a]|uniref:hypothetical protein n=1 Tax=Peterkaempfera podocarpi TaxID=3232308 RepID=UPI00366D7D72
MSGGVRHACRKAAVVVVLGTAAVGCGIRPTSVPVDAGAPASRTACPATPAPTASATASSPPASALNAPFSAKQASPGGSPSAFGPTALPSPHPSNTATCFQHRP